MFLRNVGSYKKYAVIHPRRRYSSYSPPWKPQILTKFHSICRNWLVFGVRLVKSSVTMPLLITFRLTDTSSHDDVKHGKHEQVHNIQSITVSLLIWLSQRVMNHLSPLTIYWVPAPERHDPMVQHYGTAGGNLWLETRPQAHYSIMSMRFRGFFVRTTRISSLHFIRPWVHFPSSPGQRWKGKKRLSHGGITNSVELSTTREATSCSATRWIHSILWNPKIHYRVYKRSPPGPILSQTNPVHNIQSYLWKGPA
jgi:hypothetical protein